VLSSDQNHLDRLPKVPKQSLDTSRLSLYPHVRFDSFQKLDPSHLRVRLQVSQLQPASQFCLGPIFWVWISHSARFKDTTAQVRSARARRDIPPLGSPSAGNRSPPHQFQSDATVTRPAKPIDNCKKSIVNITGHQRV